ncbi:MAG TPA: DUF302 domain-containing protein [Mucilaginibacter sp.]|jgi:uncharacterized protein (DUF302 family)|nr:DUF302 domain-containing protein [Mucilaginibacter sp.]
MDNGIITMASPYTVKETVDRLENMLRSKGAAIFTRIDQQATARLAGLEMPATELLLFGNPKAGTALMLAKPLSGLDLPLKVLAWQDKEGKNWLSYNSFGYLQQRFSLSDDLIHSVALIEGLIKAAVAP